MKNVHRLANSGAVSRAGAQIRQERKYGALVAFLLILAAIVLAAVLASIQPAAAAGAPTSTAVTATVKPAPTATPAHNLFLANVSRSWPLPKALANCPELGAPCN